MVRIVFHPVRRNLFSKVRKMVVRYISQKLNTLREEIFAQFNYRGSFREKNLQNLQEFNYAVEALSTVSRNLISRLINILQFLVQKSHFFQS